MSDRAAGGVDGAHQLRPLVGERKGLVGGVLHERQQVHGWEVAALQLPDLPTIDWDRDGPDGPGPVLHRGERHVDDPADGFIALDGWTKGYVWVNGWCLGRYWERGPQRTLYLPGPMLKPGANEIVVLEMDRCDSPVVQLLDAPDLEGSAAR